jgi:hypothetical protein
MFVKIKVDLDVGRLHNSCKSSVGKAVGGKVIFKKKWN